MIENLDWIVALITTMILMYFILSVDDKNDN
jgi:hypothetical protein